MFIVGLTKLVSSDVPAMIMILGDPSFSIMIGDPQLGQKCRCIGSPLVPPGAVYVFGLPVMVMASLATATKVEKAVPRCR
jgi:hypothetical protein